MKKLVGLFAILIGGWFWASPYYATYQLQAAVRQGDAARLASYVDFPAVRESLKSQLKAKALDELALDDTSNNLEALGGLVGSLLGAALIDSVVDTLITADGLALLIRSGHLESSDTGAEEPTIIDSWTVKHRDLSHFELRNTTATDPTVLIFERTGLEWKLVRVQIPKSLL